MPLLSEQHELSMEKEKEKLLCYALQVALVWGSKMQAYVPGMVCIRVCKKRDPSVIGAVKSHCNFHRNNIVILNNFTGWQEDSYVSRPHFYTHKYFEDSKTWFTFYSTAGNARRLTWPEKASARHWFPVQRSQTFVTTWTRTQREYSMDTEISFRPMDALCLF